MTDPRIIARCVLMLAGAAACAASSAQAAAPSATDSVAAHKAQKETDRTMYWIRVLASTPAPKAAPVPKVAATPRRVKVAAAAAPAPSTADSANASPSQVVATAPSLAAAPAADDEPDPGLIMIKSADPAFPFSTMRRLRKGEVEVKFEVGTDGVVVVVTVMKTTNTSLNSAAVEAVRQWRFKPTPKVHTALVDLAFNLDI